MKGRSVIAAALLLAACDEPTVITHVDRRPGFKLGDLWAIQDARGIPVEIHGRAFSHVSDRELAEALRPPASSAQEVAFYATPPGSWQGREGWRLVLHFNPQGAPNAYKDCQRVEEARTNASPSGSFTVNASFCRGERWEAHGYMQVLEIDDGDLEAFSETMRTLMMAIFREEPDR